MSWIEHTPQEQRVREVPADPPVSPSPEAVTLTPPENESPQTQSATSIRVRELHLYTIPNREYSGHYSGSQLFLDVSQNPALYMDRADF